MLDRDRAVNENLGLVHACAIRFRGKGIEYEDLYQAGCEGLIKAANRFDPDLGYRFSTYAVPVIMGEIRKMFRDGGIIKVSRSIRELSIKVNRVGDEFVKEHGREPTVSELAKRLDTTEEAVTEAIGSSVPPVSLTISNEDGEIQNDIPIPSHDGKIIELMALRTELEKLPAIDRELVKLRFFKRVTQSAAARQLGMTQVQVSRREKKILELLRKKLGSF